MSYEILFRQAIEHHQNGEFDQAEQIYRQILETLPSHPDILNLLGLIAQAKNIHQEAINLFYQAIQADNKRAQFYFNLGISLHLWNKPYEALEAFEKSAQLDNSIKETWLEIGNIRQELNSIPEAQTAYNKALEIDKHYVEAHIKQISLNSNTQEAIQQLIELQQHYPNNPQIDFELGLLYFKQQDLINALPHATKATMHLPFNGDAHSLLGQILLSNNNITEAQKAFINTLEITPNNIPALINLGNIEVQNKNYTLAETYYRRAIELDSANFDAHHNYATMLHQQNRLSEALEEYRKAIIINPKRAEACNNLGLILREQKEFEDALGLFFNAFTLNSNLEEISINISETLILYFTEEPQTALDIAKNWHQQYPNNIFAQHTLASLQGINQAENQEYSKKLFDNFAPSYEATLLELDYQIPSKIAQILGNISGNILDLGCGTGLTGKAIKNNNNTLYGVDISSNMLKLAKQKNIYHELSNQDIVNYLKDNKTKFDYIISADVFCYFSDLEPIISNCNSTPLCFSIETTQETEKYQISNTGRYKHSPLYIKQLLNKYNYTQIVEYPLTLRNENNQPVLGIIFVAKP